MKKHLKDYFIPHEGNAYKPHSLQTAAMTGMVVLVLLSFTLANIQSLIWISSEWMISAVLPSVIVDLTNDARADNNLLTVRRSTVLDTAAQMKADDMARFSYFAHYSPTGVSPWYWFNQASYNFVNAGENLAIHFTDTNELVDAWLESPTHRLNIMNGNYLEIGIGVAEGTFEGYNTLYVVQFFGTQGAVVSEPPSVSLAQADTEGDVIELEFIDEPQIAGVEEEVLVLDSETESGKEAVVATDTTSENNNSTSEFTDETDVIDVIRNIEVIDDSIVLFSDDISTSTGGIPATIDSNSSIGGDKSSNPFAIATQPQYVLQLLYIMIGLFVVVSLILSVLIEVRRQHPVQIAYGVAMLLFMYGLYTLHTSLSQGALIV